MLVGEGAKQWAIKNNLEKVSDDYHKTGEYCSIFLKFSIKNEKGNYLIFRYNGEIK